MTTGFLRCACLALILSPVAAPAQQNCEIVVSRSDGRASISAMTREAAWSGGEYTMNVAVRSGTNRSNSMQHGTVGSATDGSGAVVLSRTVVSLSDDSEVD
ncbi:MAG: curli-like amyloid fiber formation chaperone CsgH, partial [Gammaproteobacteria bacterium]|nr:curli-like amyloid fiber formation chaperone CsgH [Gammaproteobacteria bacterium]